MWSRQGGDQSIDEPTEGRGRSIPGSGTPDKLLEPGEQKLPGDHQTRPDGKHEKRWAGARRQEPVGYVKPQLRCDSGSIPKRPAKPGVLVPVRARTLIGGPIDTQGRLRVTSQS